MQIEIERKTLVQYLDMVNTIVPEAVLSVSSAGMAVKVVDGSHVQLLSLSLPSVVTDEETTFAVDVDKIHDKIKKMKTDKVQIIKNGNKITIVGDNKRFNTHTIEKTNLADPKIPGLSESTSIEVEVKKMQEAMAFMDGESVQFNLMQDGLKITSPDNTDSSEDMLQVEGNIDQTRESTFSYSMVNAFTKLINAEKMQMKIGNDYPLVLAGNTLGIKYMYIIAPRIENE